MTEDQARAFVRRMCDDEAFRASVLAEEGVDARMARVAAEGYVCTLDEIGAASAEIGDAELEGIVGGLLPSSGALPGQTGFFDPGDPSCG